MLLFAGTPANTPFVPKLPDTGQTTSYTATFGEDSDYTINPPSYTDNGDGTVTDNNTGLMWQQEDDNTKYNWYEASGTADATYNSGGAVDVCGDLSTGGYTDWRLPNRMEFMTLVDYGTYYPNIDTTYFPGTKSSWYWSSTSWVQNSSYAWYVPFDRVDVNFNVKSYAYYVRCVRGELQAATFTDNGDGTVTDGDTGLIWQQGDGGQMTWESALTYCEGLTLAGASDWRLPNIRELQTIVDDTTYFPAIDTTYFPGTSTFGYWSSTSDALNSTFACRVYFNPGNVGSNSKSGYNYARCVRGGQ